MEKSMTEYTDRQRQLIRESLQRLRFQDAVICNYAETGSLSSEDITDLLARARKLAQKADDVDAGNAADIVTMIRGYRN
jgi:hypothetical protein